MYYFLGQNQFHFYSLHLCSYSIFFLHVWHRAIAARLFLISFSTFKQRIVICMYIHSTGYYTLMRETSKIMIFELVSLITCIIMNNNLLIHMSLFGFDKSQLPFTTHSESTLFAITFCYNMKAENIN